MESKDIIFEKTILQKGDIIYYHNSDEGIGKIFVTDDDTLFHFLVFVPKNSELIKVERPVKYETIYEAPEEILDKEEKENTILKKALKKMYKDLSNRCQALPPYEWYIEQAEKE